MESRAKEKIFKVPKLETCTLLEFYFSDGEIAAVYNRICNGPFTSVRQAEIKLFKEYPGFTRIMPKRDSKLLGVGYYLRRGIIEELDVYLELRPTRSMFINN